MGTRRTYLEIVTCTYEILEIEYTFQQSYEYNDIQCSAFFDFGKNKN